MKTLAEAFGTFTLVFAGTGAIVVNESSQSITHVGIALTFGLVVMAMIYTFGSVSGAHINPAVTLALAVAGRCRWQIVLPYIASQLMGALLASLTIKFLFPASQLLGATLPTGSWHQSWVMEFILTLVLLVTILSFTERQEFAGLAIGAVIGLEALFAGPVSGASMNPARSIAPALVSGHLEYLWIYLSAPIVGALAGVGISRLVFKP